MTVAAVQLGTRRGSFVWLPDADRQRGLPVGVLVTHRLPLGQVCHTVIPWAGAEPVVQLESLRPLTLAGDFWCGCGIAGRIVDGEWVEL